MANILGEHFSQRYDVTATGEHKLSPRTAALLVSQTVTSLGFGWLADRYSLGTVVNNLTQAVDTSGVVNPAPAPVYQNFATVNSGPVSYRLPVPDGDYTIRLHFVEPTFGANVRKFDILLQGLVQRAGLRR